MGLREQAAFARMLGLSGESAVHPHQFSILHENFTPTAAEESSRAREVIGAFNAAGGEALRLSRGEFAHRARRLFQLAAGGRS